MLLQQLIHPEILSVLASAGHHGLVLIADGNYPASSKRGPNARMISMNLMPGVITCNQALQAVISAVPIEAAYTMQTESSGPYALEGDPPVWSEYRKTLAEGKSKLELQPLDKWDFYKHVMTEDHVLTIQTADQQRYANILLAIGVRM
jgi:L-fucose mutarotase